MLRRLAGIAALVLVLGIPTGASGGSADQAKARFSDQSASGTLDRITSPPVTLGGGSRLTVVSPQRWLSLAERLQGLLKTTHTYYADLFSVIPPFSVSLRLMPDQLFYETTGAPGWTNALYYKNQIIIPVNEATAADYENVARSLRHEYTHAIVHALSAGRCPGWFDEGMAQWAEGSENPALQPALANWLAFHDPVPLSLLQTGFTRLDPDMVPAAYAQALFATNALIENFGFQKIGRFFAALRGGYRREQAFEREFGITEKEFEGRLRWGLKDWARNRKGRRNIG